MTTILHSIQDHLFFTGHPPTHPPTQGLSPNQGQGAYQALVVLLEWELDDLADVEVTNKQRGLLVQESMELQDPKTRLEDGHKLMRELQTPQKLQLV